MGTITKHLGQTEIKAKFENINGEDLEVFDIIISTSNIDQAGDVMNLSGRDASLFNDTKAVFYNHDTYSMPVAKCLGISMVGNMIIAKTWFHELTEESREVKALVKAGVINHASIGFEVIEYSTRPLSDDEKLKLPKLKQAVVYEKWKLLEYSIVPIPMNQDAKILREKAGRTLSKANESKLNEAITLINSVLESGLQGNEEEEKSIEIEELRTSKSLLEAQLKEAIEAKEAIENSIMSKKTNINKITLKGF